MCIHAITLLALTFLPPHATQDSAVAFEEARVRLMKLSEAEWKELESIVANPSRPPSQAGTAILSQLGHARNALLRGTVARDHDFEGSGADLAQSKYTELECFLSADAINRMHSGDHMGAAASLRSGYALALRLTEPGTTHSSRQALGIVKRVDAIVGYGVERGAIDPSAASTILRTLKDYDSVDPLNCTAAIGNAFDGMIERYKLTLGYGGTEGLQKFLQLQSREASLRDRTVDELMHELTVTLPAIKTEVLAAIAVEDREASTKQLHAIVTSLEGTLAGELLRWLPQLNAQIGIMKAGAILVNARRQSLERIIAGASNVEQNAAVWYCRGAVLFDALTREELDCAIKVLSGENLVTPDDYNLEVSERVHEALGHFEQGAKAATCDWDAVRPTDVCLVNWYIYGAYDAIRCLRASVSKEINEQSPTKLIGLYSTWFTLLFHLSREHSQMASIVSQNSFVEALSSLRQAVAIVPFRTDDIAILRNLVGRVSGSDPFGHQAAATNSRRCLSSAIDDARGLVEGRKVVGAGTAEERDQYVTQLVARRMAISDELGTMGPDVLFVALVAFEDANDPLEARLNRLARLGENLVQAQLEPALRLAQGYRQLILRESKTFASIPLPEVTRIGQLQERVAADIESASGLLDHISPRDDVIKASSP